MAWNPKIKGEWNAKYLYFKNNYRVGKKTKSRYIYFGPIDVAAEMLGELQTKPLIDEKIITCSGETILKKMANSIGFVQVLGKYANKKEALILRNIIILRALFNESKKGLVDRILLNSILKDETDVQYVGKIYRSMDLIYNHLNDIIYELAKNAVKRYSLNLDYLVIDGTGIKVYKDEETDLIKFGYPLGGLPQVKVVLCVNKQHVPLLCNCYPGNTSDAKVFEDFVKGLNLQYMELSKKSKKKYVVFDQGNVNKKNFVYMCQYKDERIFLVSLLRYSTSKKFIDKIDKSKLEVIYEKKVGENNHTKIYGKHLNGEAYGKKCSILVCYNPDIAEQKNKTLDRRIDDVKKKIIEVNKSKMPDTSEVTALISTYNLKTSLKVKKIGEKISLDMNDDELENRRRYFGFFVIFSNDLTLGCEMINIYKFRNIIEEGFRVLKSDMEITPEYHSRDDRIETHNVMVVCSYLLLSILRAVLSDHGDKYSFAELKRFIASGCLQEGYYEHNQFKKNRLWIRKPIGFEKELISVFSSLKIKIPKFDMALHPQN